MEMIARLQNVSSSRQEGVEKVGPMYFPPYYHYHHSTYVSPSLFQIIYLSLSIYLSFFNEISKFELSSFVVWRDQFSPGCGRRRGLLKNCSSQPTVCSKFWSLMFLCYLTGEISEKSSFFHQITCFELGKK